MTSPAPGSRLVAHLALAASLLTAVATFASDPVPLALVAEDTLTTTDLRIELVKMRNRNTTNATTRLNEPAGILRRMIQNQLVIQEGYRMGLHESFTVRNEVSEILRHECMAALLDSVAAGVPVVTANLEEARVQVVKAYMQDLFERHHASVDSALLRKLDYGSADKDMQKYLRESDDPLAIVPTKNLTVADFSREVRFTAFHGLVGKADAAERRDRILSEWVQEALLTHQFRLQGIDRRPSAALLAERVEISKVLEESLRILLQFEFEPSEPEVEEYYATHLAQVTAKPRLKMASLKVATPEIAAEMRELLRKGATIRWLSNNDDRVVKGPAPFPEDWFPPEMLGLELDEVSVGYIPEPYGVPAGWVVAQITEIEQPQPRPLEQCRSTILKLMKADESRRVLLDILVRLEDATPVTILPGAEDEIARIIAETEADSEAQQTAPVE